ncbi:MAG: 16S rRNA (cytidine(1402)-2'-O)-methyltransferase [Candidatus Vogelbacteria bacterium]|nr:16S rRNA (cytidine(1402)-2'-O)-methyltransferase [Candidatus Vogelbacteria bacterium]
MADLFIVATPIGNLEDITLRALRVLGEVDLILCEDTRVTRKLLDHYEIKVPVESYHEHSDLTKTEKILSKLENRENIALVTDAGTPGISDPGSKLITEVRKRFGLDVKIHVIPGPSALTAALSISGLDQTEFEFLGFLPHKKGRETIFKRIKETENAFVFYESPHRVIKTLISLMEFLNPERQIFIARELTKSYEESFAGTAKEALDYFTSNPDKIRGEFVIIVMPIKN